jgi:nucleotide-binding universal stress UspA family protein
MRHSVRAPIDTVMCAIDFSETAQFALDQAVRFARRHGARLVLAHVVEPIQDGPYSALMIPSDDDVVLALVTPKLEDLAATHRVDELVVETRIEKGQPGPQLINIAEATEADLILIGTRGLTGMKNLMLGSTAEHVVRCGLCPVLTMHPSDRLLDGAIETVVLPTDLSPDATRAAEAFVRLFGEWSRPRIILAFADRPAPYLQPFRHDTLLRFKERDVVKEEREQKMAPVVAILRAADFEVETVVLDGDPVTVTTDLARSRDADLIAMTTHRRSSVLNVLTGKTAQRIVRHAPCPVLTVLFSSG